MRGLNFVSAGLLCFSFVGCFFLLLLFFWGGGGGGGEGGGADFHENWVEMLRQHRSSNF